MRRSSWLWHQCNRMAFQCNRMVCYTLLSLETAAAGSFTVSEHKSKMLVACQMLHIYFSKFIHKYNNVTVHIK